MGRGERRSSMTWWCWYNGIEGVGCNEVLELREGQFPFSPVCDYVSVMSRGMDNMTKKLCLS